MTKKIFVVAVAMSATSICSLSALAQDLSTARGVLEAHVEATGGMDAWNAVEDLHVEALVEVETPMGALGIEMSMWSIFPGYGFTDMKLSSGPDGIPPEMVNMKAYYTPLEGWLENAQGRQDLNDLAPQMRQQFVRSSPKNALTYIAMHDSLLVLHDASTFDGHDVYVVGITTFGIQSKIMIDKESLLMLAQEVDTPAGAATTVFGEYMKIDGLLFSSGQVTESTQQNSSISFSTIEINTGLTPAQLAAKSGARAAATPE